MTYKVRGKAYWAKILGGPFPGYQKPGTNVPAEKEWSMDLSLDEEGVKTMTNAGVGDSIRTGKGKDYEPFVTFKRAAIKRSGPKAGQPNRPIDVEDAVGIPWDQTKLIGNESFVEVEFNTFPTTSKPVILRVTVIEYVPYERPDKPEWQHKQTEEEWADK